MNIVAAPTEQNNTTPTMLKLRVDKNQVNQSCCCFLVLRKKLQIRTSRSMLHGVPYLQKFIPRTRSNSTRLEIEARLLSTKLSCSD